MTNNLLKILSKDGKARSIEIFRMGFSHREKACLRFLGIVLVLLLFGEAAAPSIVLAKYIQLDAVAGVRTRFSSGCSTVQELANIAQHRKIDAVIFGDYHQQSLEYGLSPLERILKKQRTQTSILSTGAAAYLSEIEINSKNMPDVLMLPGTEVAPFYYWTGSPFDKNLTANNWDKHLTIVGMDKPEDYEQIPTLNSNFSKKYLNQLLPKFGVFAALFLICFALGLVKKDFRKSALFFALVFLLLAINNHPLKSSRFDQYGGDKGIEPYQDLIDYAESKGALVFWNHLESTAGLGKNEAVGLKTLPHPEDLALSKNFSGFEAVYDSMIHITEPEKEWDEILMQYVRGERERPVWGYGGNDFNCEQEEGRVLGGVRSILLVKEKTREAVFDAMKNGRMYAVRQPDEFRLSLDEFIVSDKVAGKEAALGEEIQSQDFPELKVKIRSTRPGEQSATLSIVRNGKMVKQETVSLPYELVWRDVEVEKKGRVYYRLVSRISSKDYLISNPVFVNFSRQGEVASLPQSPTESATPPKAPEAPKPPESPKDAAVPVVSETKQPREPKHAEPAEPKIAEPVEPRIAEPVEPKVAMKAPEPAPPPKPIPAPLKPAEGKVESRQESPKMVVARIDGVVLKKGPGANFPQVGTAKKDERLTLLKKTNSDFQGKPWLEVQQGGKKVYVWEGFVKYE